MGVALSRTNLRRIVGRSDQTTDVPSDRHLFPGGHDPQVVGVGFVNETRLGWVYLQRLALGAGKFILDALEVAPVADSATIVVPDGQVEPAVGS